MNTPSIIIAVIVGLGLIVISLALSISGLRISRSISEHNSIKREELYSKILNSNLTADQLIGKLVQETFDRYVIFHSEIQTLKYINEELQNRIIRDISTIVVSKMSEPVLNYISIFITQEKIIDTVNEYTITAVIDFCIEKNVNEPTL